MKNLTTLDFETKPIEKGAAHPPLPVGVALYPEGKDPYYMAWGHPLKNNCDIRTATNHIRAAFRNGPVLCHNAKFDYSVAQYWFGVPIGRHIEDTLFMAYLDDPRRRTLELKDLAHEELGMPPDEQQDLKEWLQSNYPPAKRAKKNWGKYIAEAPGDIVGRYAIGDVVRTRKLFEHYLPIIKGDAGLWRSYQRELRLLPVIMEMEAKGVPIREEIHEAHEKYQKELDKINVRLHRKLGDINVGHGPSLFKAAEARGLVDHDQVQYTDKGNPRTGRDFVADWCTDRGLVNDVDRRSRLVKVVGTYLRPWAECGGTFYPYFNQTRNDREGGTRTGRLSSNFQQVPREPDDPTIPFLRNFIWAGPDRAVVARDYSSQEIRILAHYAEGSLLEAYNENPELDVHQWVKELILDTTGLELDRSHTKQANFLQVYGGGVPALSDNLGIDESFASKILHSHRKALPEVKQLSTSIEQQLRDGVLLRTWGGRLYDVEYGMSKRGTWEKLYYKMINVLIQGSAADQTKELMIDAHTAGLDLGIQVHDELLIWSLIKAIKRDMRVLRELMNDSTGWDVPMLSDGKVGLESWGQARKWDDNIEDFKNAD